MTGVSILAERRTGETDVKITCLDDEVLVVEVLSPDYHDDFTLYPPDGKTALEMFYHPFAYKPRDVVPCT